MKKLFEEEFNKAYLKYHTDPISPNSLDPRIWYFQPDGGDPRLQPQVKTQILSDIDKINSVEQDGVRTRVWDYFMVGPALSEKSSDSCPVNILVQINTANLSDMLKEHILNRIKDINGRRATGSLHPIYYIPTIRTFDINAYDAVYHPFTEKWIKKPRFLGEAKVDLKDIARDPAYKKNRKHPLKKGFKKLGTI